MQHIYLGTLPNGRVDLVGDIEDGPAELVYHFEAADAPKRVIAKVERVGNEFVCGSFSGSNLKEVAKAAWEDLERRHSETESARHLRNLQRRHEETPCTEMEEARAYAERQKGQSAASEIE